MFVWIFLLSVEFESFGLEDSAVQLEPGHAKQDCDSVEEVRGQHVNETIPEKIPEDESALREAILDVAYYLRRFKFNGCDPRHSSPQKKFFAGFPFPPLKNVHWEVKKNCESSFGECVKYLQDRVGRTVLPRRLDSVSVTRRNGWSFPEDEDSIRAADEECLRLLAADEITFDAFAGPLQKFQWLTSASYYMCLYAMKETGSLKFFAEDCDDFGSCIRWDVGPNNRDFRGDNSHPFACALYSFCPDPCCPVEYLRDPTACFDAGPCSSSSAADRTCWLTKKNNVDMESIMLNRWNVSCNCDRVGTRWDSKSGMCVDIDECAESDSICNFPSETCKNLRGSYKCTCSPMGYTWNPGTNACEPDSVLQRIFHPSSTPAQPDGIRSLSDKIASAISKLTSARSPPDHRTESNLSDFS